MCICILYAYVVITQVLTLYPNSCINFIVRRHISLRYQLHTNLSTCSAKITFNTVELLQVALPRPNRSPVFPCISNTFSHHQRFSCHCHPVTRGFGTNSCIATNMAHLSHHWLKAWGYKSTASHRKVCRHRFPCFPRFEKFRHPPVFMEAIRLREASKGF